MSFRFIRAGTFSSVPRRAAASHYKSETLARADARRASWREKKNYKILLLELKKGHLRQAESVGVSHSRLEPASTNMNHFVLKVSKRHDRVQKKIMTMDVVLALLTIRQL